LMRLRLVRIASYRPGSPGFLRDTAPTLHIYESLRLGFRPRHLENL
jgi:hypothetical protein